VQKRGKVVGARRRRQRRRRRSVAAGQRTRRGVTSRRLVRPSGDGPTAMLAHLRRVPTWFAPLTSFSALHPIQAGDERATCPSYFKRQWSRRRWSGTTMNTITSAPGWMTPYQVRRAGLAAAFAARDTERGVGCSLGAFYKREGSRCHDRPSSSHSTRCRWLRHRLRHWPLNTNYSRSPVPFSLTPSAARASRAEDAKAQGASECAASGVDGRADCITTSKWLPRTGAQY
jgi:hypothetical protein